MVLYRLSLAALRYSQYCILLSAWHGTVPSYSDGALTVQPVLYLTVGMVWHCTVLLLMLCTASIVSYRRHGIALYRLTHGALTVQPVLCLTVGMAWQCTVLLMVHWLYSQYCILPSAWHGNVPSYSWCTDCTASIVSYRRHGMAMYRLTHGALTVQPVLYLTVGMVWHSVYRLTSDALYSQYCILPSAWYGTQCTVLLPMLCTASIVSYRRHGMALYRLTSDALYSEYCILPSAWYGTVPSYFRCSVQRVLYLTVSMAWHCTVLLMVHGTAILPSAWPRYGIAPSYSCTVQCTASIVSYPGHGMASYRLTPGTLGSFIQCVLGYDARTPLQVDLCID